MVGIVDHIPSKVAVAALDRGLVFFWRSPGLVVGRKLWTAIAHDLQRVVTIAVEHQKAIWIGAVKVNPCPICFNVVDGNETPGPDQFLRCAQFLADSRGGGHCEK